DGIAPAHALEINSISMAMLLPVLIVAGLLADRYGRKPFLLFATALGFVGALPLFWLLFQTSLPLVQLGQFGFVLLVGVYCGVQPTFMVEIVPVQVRCTAVALGYNICLGIIGGLTPLVATWLVERTEDETAPAFLIMAAAAVSFLTVVRLPESLRKP